MSAIQWVPLNEAVRRMQRSRELSSFYTRWAAAESSGLPALQALPTLKSGAQPWIAARIDALIDGFDAGESLEQAAAGEPFLPIERAMLAAGAAAGDLPGGLDALADLFATDDRISRRVQVKSTYPLLLAICACWIPTAPIAFNSGVLAWLAVAVPGTALVIALGGTFVVARFEYTRGKPRWARIRFFRAMASAMRAGVMFDEALRLSIAVAAPSRVADGLRRVDPAGKTLRAVLAESGAFSQPTVAMVDSGELSGALDTTLRKVADYLEDEVL